METDSNSNRASYRRLATLAVVLSLALVPLSGVGAAQQADTAGNQSYVAIQGTQCTPITAFSGDESAIEYYDYRIPEENSSDLSGANATGDSFASEGTADLQQPDTSTVFLYTDTSENSTYLVFVHGALDNENADGGVATFNIAGLPEDGEWTVRDDDYDGGGDDWRVTETISSVTWDWDGGATDGGVYSGIDNNTSVTIEPAFNEEVAEFGSNDGTVEQWQVLSNEVDDLSEEELSQGLQVSAISRTDLDLDEGLQISAGTCDDFDLSATDDIDDNDTDANETATVTFEDQESDGTSVTVDNVTVPNDGYVAIHNDSLLDGDAVGSVVGVSDYLEAGTYENRTVGLYDVPGADFNESELTENQTLIAMPHEETTGDETYDFVSSNGTDDGPYTADGAAVTDDAAITIVNDTADTETATPADNETATPADNETATPADNETATP